MAGSTLVPLPIFDTLVSGAKLSSFPSELIDRASRSPYPVMREKYTGTFGIIGFPGRSMGTEMSSSCSFGSMLKTVVVKLDSSYASLVDKALCCDHGFSKDGAPLLRLSNARTGRLIRTDDDMSEAGEVLLTLNGPVTARLSERNSYGAGMSLLYSGEVFFDPNDENSRFNIRSCSTAINTSIIGISDRYGLIQEVGTPLIDVPELKFVPELSRGPNLFALLGSDEHIRAVVRFARANAELTDLPDGRTWIKFNPPFNLMAVTCGASLASFSGSQESFQELLRRLLGSIFLRYSSPKK
ncbi:MAG: hypothetical protein WCT31_04335 [Candidatus Micrarchaeia archaeon]